MADKKFRTFRKILDLTHVNNLENTKTKKKTYDLSFSIMTYNILAQMYVNPSLYYHVED